MSAERTPAIDASETEADLAEIIAELHYVATRKSASPDVRQDAYEKIVAYAERAARLIRADRIRAATKRPS